MIELPPLSPRQNSLLLEARDRENNENNTNDRDDKKQKDESLLLRMTNGYRKNSNFDSSASSTSKSHSSGGLLIKRSKTSNNLSTDVRLGTLFEQKKSTSPSRQISTKHLTRTISTQKIISSDHGSTTTGSNLPSSTCGNKTLTAKQRCVSSNDLTRMDKNNNRNNLIRHQGAPLYRHKSEQKINQIRKVSNGTTTTGDKISANDRRESKSTEMLMLDKREEDEESSDSKAERILAWLKNVEQFAEPPPEVPSDGILDEPPPQTDTAIHVVYNGNT